MVLITTILFTGCTASSVYEEREYQETLINQANDVVGMPEITNFYEKKLAKEILELRDDSDLICYAYTYNNMTGKFTYLGRCMGYGLPYSTQYTRPETAVYIKGKYEILPQADPNGLYLPDGINATWLYLIDENTGESQVTYIESEITVSQGKIPARLCEEFSLPEDY